MSLTGMPITAEMAEKWGLVNHVVDSSEVLNKAIEIAEAITRNNRDMVLRYKSVINDGFKLDLAHALDLEKVAFLCYRCKWNLLYLTESSGSFFFFSEKFLWFQERAHSYYDGMTKEQFGKMQEFIRSRRSKPASKL